MLHNPPTSGDPVVCISLFSCDLPSAVGFHKPWHQGEGFATQQEVVYIWSSLSQGFRWRKPKGAILNLLLLNIVHLLKNHLTQHLPRPISILHRERLAAPGKEDIVVVIFTHRSLWLLHGNMFSVQWPESMGNIPSDSDSSHQERWGKSNTLPGIHQGWPSRPWR